MIAIPLSDVLVPRGHHDLRIIVAPLIYLVLSLISWPLFARLRVRSRPNEK